MDPAALEPLPPLAGTPLQNNLVEYYHMVNYAKPGYLGSLSRFKSLYEDHILVRGSRVWSGKGHVLPQGSRAWSDKGRLLL